MKKLTVGSFPYFIFVCFLMFCQIIEEEEESSPERKEYESSVTKTGIHLIFEFCETIAF